MFLHLHFYPLQITWGFGVTLLLAEKGVSNTPTTSAPKMEQDATPGKK